MEFVTFQIKLFGYHIYIYISYRKRGILGVYIYILPDGIIEEFP